MSLDELNAEEKLEQSPDGSSRDDTYPTTDTDQDSTELYQQGLDIQEPNAGNTVKGYDPDKDHRLK
jgi:hypothetical protein